MRGQWIFRVYALVVYYSHCVLSFFFILALLSLLLMWLLEAIVHMIYSSLGADDALLPAKACVC